jgi:hypothetical protein
MNWHLFLVGVIDGTNDFLAMNLVLLLVTKRTIIRSEQKKHGR